MTSTSSCGSVVGGVGLSLGVDDGVGCGGNGGGSDVESERSAVTGGGGASSVGTGEKQQQQQTRVHFCGQCKKTFYNSYNLKRHVKAVHEGGNQHAQATTKTAIRLKRKKDDDVSSNDDAQSQVTSIYTLTVQSGKKNLSAS